MFCKLFVFGILLIFQQNFKHSFSSPLKSFDPFDFLGIEESKRSEREGQCPVFPVPNECPPRGEDDACKIDEDCSLPKKCCSDGCGKICIDPENDSACKDLRQDCDSIPLKGDKLTEYCEKWKKNPAIRQCKKTCGWCKPPSPTVCEDKRDDCKWILNNAGHYLPEYCQQHKDDPAVKECPKTCGFCKLNVLKKGIKSNQNLREIIDVVSIGKKIPSPTKKFPTQPPVPQTLPKITEQPGVKPGPKPTNKPQGNKNLHVQIFGLLLIASQPRTDVILWYIRRVQITGFQKECLEAHNKYRALHGSPPLAWSAELTKDAQEWANYLARRNKFYHYPGLRKLDQGENLAWFSPARKECDGPSDEKCVHCGEMVKDWYNEVVDYDFKQGKGKSPYDVVTHFTQVVWKGTRELGMATAIANNRLVAVARYRKSGNIGSPEDFKNNVLMPNE
ncbi:uncharacterized protein LOC116288213 [Actinia tenebrosa]|uniref:Uncharacterized protein LOC116288213 n=1 Tax=Actinia tenebrosa TaxID=6105 RepID=A0A6P8HE44_ACTTE|nr:uncharacterized protein LOC116288213 [Actinia tenebrosa]